MPRIDDERDDRDRAFDVMFIVFLVLLVIGGIFITANFEIEFIRAFGHALIIAGILGLSIDPYIKRRLLRESLRSIDTLLIGYGLPPELQHKIKDIMRTTVIRNPLLLHFKLTPINDEPNKCLIETFITYELENISNAVEWFQQYFFVEKANKPKIRRLCCTLDDQSIKYCFDEQMLRDRNLLKEDEEVVKAYGEDISLQPSSSKKPKKYRFYCEHSEVFPANHTDSFRLSLPRIQTINVIVTAEYPADRFSFRTSLERIDVSERQVAPTKWEALRAFLPNEQIDIHWEPNKEEKDSISAGVVRE